MWIGKGYIKMEHKKQNRWELNWRDRIVDAVLTVLNSVTEFVAGDWPNLTHTY